MLNRRDFAVLLGAASVPGRALAAGETLPFYASAGPRLTVYSLDVEKAVLAPTGENTLPANIQYAWPHPSKKFLYVVASNTQPGSGPMGATGADLGTSDGWGPGNDIVYNSTATTTLLTLLEASGKANVTYSVVALTGLTAAPEVEPNDTPPTAQALTLTPLGADKGVLLAGTTESSTAVDYFKVTLAAGDVGKRIHVRTGNSDYVYIDVAVADSNGKSLGSALHKSETTDLYSEPVTAAGDYVVEVRGDYTGAYNLVVSVQ